MATTTIGLLGTFREFGLSAAAIQAPNLPDEDRDALFWFNFFSTTVVTCTVLLIAPAVASFYREPQVEFLLKLAAFGFFISGLSTQHNALLRRTLSFGAIFMADFGGLFIGSAVAVALATYSADAVSLVVGSIVQAAFSSVVTIWLGRWLPHAPRNLRAHLKHASFGANVSVFSLLNFLTNNIASIVVGRWADASAMGFLNRAQSLYALPSNFILGPYLQVQFPLLCRAFNNNEETRRIYSSLLLFTGITFIPAGVVLPFVATDLTRIILGPQWIETGRILAWFSPAIVSLGLIGPFGQYMTSQGRVRELSLWGLGDFAIRGGGAAFGAVFGAQQAAAGFSLATLLVATPILVWITVRHGPFRFRDYFSSGYPGILIGLTTLVAVLLSKMIADSGSIGSLVLALSFSGTAWLVTMFALAPTRDLLLRPNPKGKNVGALQK
jgi:PST family polysaccharide transporter